MAVTKTVVLPAQGPDAGDITRLRPLGGNGLRGPQSLFEVQVTLAGDAGGGASDITVVFDTRFESILLCADNVNTGTALDRTAVFELGSSVPFFGVGTAQGNAITSQSIASWSPPPIVGRDQVKISTNNIDGDSQVITLLIYNYQKRASELVPLSVLLSSLPRAATFIGLTA